MGQETILGLVFVLLFWRGHRRIAEVRASGDPEANVRGGWILVGVSGLIVLGLFLNAVGVFRAEAGPYLVALFLSLTMTGLMFARLLRFA